MKNNKLKATPRLVAYLFQSNDKDVFNFCRTVGVIVNRTWRVSRKPLFTEVGKRLLDEFFAIKEDSLPLVQAKNLKKDYAVVFNYCVASGKCLFNSADYWNIEFLYVNYSDQFYKDKEEAKKMEMEMGKFMIDSLHEAKEKLAYYERIFGKD